MMENLKWNSLPTKTLTSISSSRWGGSFRIMHFRAARRPFISWGDSRPAHTRMCSCYASLFLFWEKLITFVLFCRWYSGPVQTWRKKYFFYNILHIFILSFIQFIQKKIPHNKQKSSKCYIKLFSNQPDQGFFFLLYYQTVFTFNVWTENKKVR